MLMEIYNELLGKYGEQKWWPCTRGFEPNEWEVCVGAILTQNTNWKNVEKALINLKRAGIISPERTLTSKLEELIRPSGYFRQKAERLKILARFFIDSFPSFERDKLLELKGIGPETADSILLYACNKPYFVIDAYTRRLLKDRKIIDDSWDYEKIRNLFEDNIPKDVNLYKEFHALIVENGKRN